MVVVVEILFLVLFSFAFSPRGFLVTLLAFSVVFARRPTRFCCFRGGAISFFVVLARCFRASSSISGYISRIRFSKASPRERRWVLSSYPLTKLLFLLSKILRTVGIFDRETKFAVSAKCTFLSSSSWSWSSCSGGRFTTQCHHWLGTKITSPASHIVS